jgi:anti-anti-sigma regulatory factor
MLARIYFGMRNHLVEKVVAKYRHRIFEMFEFRDEAILALAKKLSANREDDRAPISEEVKSWSLQVLTASEAEGVAHLKFKLNATQSPEFASQLREDLAGLPSRFKNDSRIVLDFEGLEEFSQTSIDDLAALRQKLQFQGSRIVLCNLEPPVKSMFFPGR